ncbi:hypothetical protein [Listeria fleischmannii]|uniref:Uncharacterized protein n=1 Tax=Listeria fleischmannii FSL S10-1203 TaxID=1265822 RepID=W7D2S5_9LIST|nr:hypothetical protein [Listeria fleischmannii]EUJ43250.1 hypothetical protein MCOL2_20548 [Listeria fleischmannii FSL S10-1203]
MNEIEVYKEWLQDHTYRVEGQNKYVNTACLYRLKLISRFEKEYGAIADIAHPAIFWEWLLQEMERQQQPWWKKVVSWLSSFQSR